MNQVRAWIHKLKLAACGPWVSLREAGPNLKFVESFCSSRTLAHGWPELRCTQPRCAAHCLNGFLLKAQRRPRVRDRRERCPAQRCILGDLFIDSRIAANNAAVEIASGRARRYVSAIRFPVLSVRAPYCPKLLENFRKLLLPSRGRLAIVHSPRSADFRWPTSRRRRSTPPRSRSSNRLKQGKVLRAHIASGVEWRNKGWLRAIFDPQMGNALSAIHDRVNSPWTVESLAEAAGMSRSAFAARFKELLGQTPLEYVTGWRMQKAMQLLEQRDKKLIDVARSVGYESDAAFSKAFKRVVGTNPGEYLKRGV
jgi:AraC-like DNA-binding protein